MSPALYRSRLMRSIRLVEEEECGHEAEGKQFGLLSQIVSMPPSRIDVVLRD